MSAAETVYFDGAHLAHVAAWEERQRLAAIDRRNKAAMRSIERRAVRR